MTRRHEVLPELLDALAEVKGCQPHDLEYSLHDQVETEALVALVASDYVDWELTFRVPDNTVTVHGDGRILVDGREVREYERASTQ